MKKKSNSSQMGFGFHVEVKPVERNEKETKVQKAEVLYTGELGLNGNWKNFGDYIKNLRGNKQNKY